MITRGKFTCLCNVAAWNISFNLCTLQDDDKLLIYNICFEGKAWTALLLIIFITDLLYNNSMNVMGNVFLLRKIPFYRHVYNSRYQDHNSFSKIKGTKVVSFPVTNYPLNHSWQTALKIMSLRWCMLIYMLLYANNYLIQNDKRTTK